MVGYIFEVTNKKTGEKYIGKNYSVAFNKNYFGKDAEAAVEKYGKSNFDIKMIMPYERIEQLDKAFDSMKKPVKEAPIEEEVKPKKRRTKKSEEE